MAVCIYSHLRKRLNNLMYIIRKELDLFTELPGYTFWSTCMEHTEIL